jgi:hypothetical protein
MAIQSTFFTKIWGSANGYWSGSVEINFPPQSAQAAVSISQTIGDGRSALGIRSFEFRDTPGGPNKTKSFSDFFWSWPPSASHKLMTRVTFGIDLYDNDCVGGIRVDFLN